MTFEQITQCFENYYDCLREIVGENAPSSYLHFAPTIQEVEEASGIAFDESDCVSLGEGDLVATAVEMHTFGWFSIREDATEEQIYKLFQDCGGEV